MPIIEVEALAKTFTGGHRTVTAVSGIDLSIAAGQVFGLLGPNGAGKTTMLRMLTTLLAPTSGSARIGGHDVRTAQNRVRRIIGYVSQAGGLDPTRTVHEELVTQGELQRLTRRAARERAAEVAEELGLGGLTARVVGSLSGGQRRRADIALGLVHRPAVLFLDEPSAGLDPRGRAELWQVIRDLRGRTGTSTVLTTHDLNEADALCDRVLIIDHGRSVAAGTPAELKRAVGGDLITVDLPADQLPEALAVLGRLPEVREANGSAGQVRLRVAAGERALLTVLPALTGAGLAPRAVGLTAPGLDDVFHAVTGRPVTDPVAHRG